MNLERASRSSGGGASIFDEAERGLCVVDGLGESNVVV